MIKRKKANSHDSFVWISYSDLITTLMLSFILIYLVALYERNKFATESEVNLKKAQAITMEVLDARNVYLDSLKQIVRAMEKHKLTNGCEDVAWNVDEKGNSIQIFFQTSEGWFADGSAVISKSGRKCLESFSYSWLLSLYAKSDYRDNIDRLVIEGHTNSLPPADKREDPYLYNLKLSQARAYEAANFIFQNLKFNNDIKKQISNFSWDDFTTWRNQVLTATGRGSAEPIKTNEVEDREKSKRIEFKFTIKHNFDGYKSIQEGK